MKSSVSDADKQSTANKQTSKRPQTHYATRPHWRLYTSRAQRTMSLSWREMHPGTAVYAAAAAARTHADALYVEYQAAERLRRFTANTATDARSETIRCEQIDVCSESLRVHLSHREQHPQSRSDGQRTYNTSIYTSMHTYPTATQRLAYL